MSEERDHLKILAARRAVKEVEDGMVVGLGTGSTAAHVVERLAERVAEGLKVKGISTSERTAAQARRLGIPITGFAEHARIDLTIDGADEVERDTLNLIKGLGGALLREKIVAAASARLIIVVDDEKLVDRLGAHTPVPVEVADPGRIERDIAMTVGAIESGLFIGRNSAVIVASTAGVEMLTPSRNPE